jgi:pyridoxine 4-dehydrogenase
VGEFERAVQLAALPALDSIALYYLHRVDPQTPLDTSLTAIKECRDPGKIRNVGLSEVGIEQIERAREIVPIAAVQHHYNLTERRSGDVVDDCAREEIAFVPSSPRAATAAGRSCCAAVLGIAVAPQIAAAGATGGLWHTASSVPKQAERFFRSRVSPV